MAIKHSLNPLGIITSFSRNKQLVFELTKREIELRYRGSILGILWTLLTPLLMLAVYAFVFGIVFQARWGEQIGYRGEFAAVLFCGLIIYSLLAECLNRAPGAIIANPVYVKKIVFPLESLAWVSLFSALFYLVTSFLMLMIFHLLAGGQFHWTIFYFPLMLIPIALAALGFSWFLSSLGVFFRDLSHIISLITTVLLFMSPIFYPLSAVPEDLRDYLYYNPLGLIIEETRRVVLWGQSPDFIIVGSLTIVGLLIAVLGYLWFQKTRKAFADVL